MKKIISIILVIVLCTTTIQTVEASSLDNKISKIQNEYIQLIVNNQNGGFVIKTVEGDLLRKSDQNKNLLYQGDDYDTSFTSFKINGEDYIYGNNYGFAGLGGEFTLSPTTNNEINKAIWKIGDIEIEQNLEVINDVSNPNIGNVIITYTATNLGEKDSEIGARIMLDTMLGSDDGVPFELDHSSNNLLKVEKKIDGSDIPTFWKAYNSTNFPSVVSYGYTSGFEGFKKPDKMIVAHWNNLAATKWDYDADSSVDFTSKYNEFETADSALAMYWNPVSIPAGQTVSFKTMYGIMAHVNKSVDATYIINTIAPRELVLNESGNAYVNDGSFEISAEIDNELLGSSDLNDVIVNLELEDGLVLEAEEESTKRFSIIESNTTKVVKWKVKAMGQSESCLKSYNITINMMNSETIYEEGFLLLPSIKATPPDIQFIVMGPETIYNSDSKYINIKGIGFDKFRDKGYWELFIQPVNTSDEKILIPDDNVIISEDNITMTIKITDDLELDEYEMYFEWSGGFFDKGYIQNVPGRIKVTDNVAYKNNRYGIIGITKSSNNYYELKTFADESDLNLYNSSKELLVVIRGNIIQSGVSKDEYIIDAKDTTASINGILTYSEGQITIKDVDNEITISGNGPLKVIGGLTFWKWKWDMSFIDKENYVLKDELDPGESEIKINLKGLGYLLQGVGGFIMDIHYGVLRRSDEYNIISFGGKMAIPIIPGYTEEDGNKEKALGGIEAEVSDVLYGERKDEAPGFIGIDLTTTVELPDNAFGGLIKNGKKASVKIDTINNIYGAGFGTKVGMLDCEGELEFKMHKGKYPIPDKLQFLIDGTESRTSIIPVIPPTVYINKLGGGIENLYDSIYGGEYILPLKINLTVGAQTTPLIDVEGTMKLALSDIEISGAASLANKVGSDKLKIIEELTLNVDWIDGVDGSLSGTINFYDGVVKGNEYIYIAEDFFEGWARVVITVPKKILIIGGKEFASIVLGANSEKVWGSVMFLGIDYGVAYYLETNKVHFAEDNPIVENPVSFAYIDSYETVDKKGNKVTGYIGTNVKEIASSYTEPTMFACLGDGYIDEMYAYQTIQASLDRKSYTVDMKDIYAGILQIEYFNNKPSLKMYDPDGIEYELIDFEKTGDLENSNMSEQIITKTINQVDEVKKYIYISIPKDHMLDGTWKLISSERVEIALLEVENLPEFTKLEGTYGSNIVKIDWEATKEEESTVDFYLCKDKEETGVLLASDIEAKEGSYSLEMPDTIVSGDYYVRAALKMKDMSYKTKYVTFGSKESFKHINFNQPDAPNSISIDIIGNGYMNVELQHNDENNIAGYIIDVLDGDNNIIDTFGTLIAGVDEEMTIGGWLPTYYVDYNTGKEVTTHMGLEPGKNYKIRGVAYKNVGDNRIASSPIISDLIYLPEIKKAQLEVEYGTGFSEIVDSTGYKTMITNQEKTNFKVISDMNINSTILVDGVYYSEEEGREFDMSISLEDGEHRIIFRALNDKGDYTEEIILVVVDTTKPLLLIESPMNSQKLEDSIMIIGQAERGARYTIELDGRYIFTNALLDEYITSSGILSYEFIVDNNYIVHNMMITARDAASNKSSQFCEFYDGKLSSIEKVYIRNKADLNDEDIEIDLAINSDLQLELIGVDADGNEYNMNSSQTSWEILLGNNIVDIEKNGSATGLNEGQAIVVGSYAISNEYSYEDTIFIDVKISSPLVDEDITILVSGNGDEESSSSSKSKRNTVERLARVLSQANSSPYIMGYTDHTFRPEGLITRGEIATIFNRILFLDEIANESTFGDVSQDYWGYESISKLKETGIVLGYPDETFKPSGNITRAELVSMIVKTYEYYSVEYEVNSNQYVDLEGHWAKEYVGILDYLGISLYDTELEFFPDQKLSRAEVIYVINQVIGLSSSNEVNVEGEDESIPFNDVYSDHWAYEAIKAADMQ